MYKKSLVNLKRLKWLAIAIAFFTVQFSPLLGFVQTANAANTINISKHEGQLKPAGTYTEGNTTTYAEGESINYRFDVSSSSNGIGTIDIEYSAKDSKCLFFDGSFHLGTHDSSALAVVNTGGISPIVSTVGEPTESGSSWFQTVRFDFSGGSGSAKVYYYLTLSYEAGNCSGSSTHTQMGNNTGEVGNTGQLTVPIPGGDIIELPQITVIKQIDENSDGQVDRNATAGEWSFSLDGGAPVATDSNGQVIFSAVKPDGLHTISESGPTEYVAASVTGTNCVSGTTAGTANATVSSGTSSTDATCYFVNRKSINPTITLIKNVINPYGTAADKDSFGLNIGSTAVKSGEVFTAEIGQKYIIDENDLTGSGYQLASIEGDGCPTALGGFTAVLVEGQDITCTITNTAIQPKLTVTKVFEDGEQYGDSATPDSFKLTVGGSPVLSGVENGYNEGPYSINEAKVPGYDFVSISGNAKCPSVLGGTITLALGDDIECTITNKAVQPKLTLKKVAINNNGGTTLSGDFTLRYNGTGLTNNSSKVDPSDSTITRTAYTRSLSTIGTYSLREDSEPGYTSSIWSCVDELGSPIILTGDDNNQLSIVLGDDISCEITNNDDAPGLTLVKQLGATYGADVDENDWLLTATGPVSTVSDYGKAQSDATLQTGTYKLDEKGPSGFTNSGWSCDLLSDDLATKLTIALGDSLKVGLGDKYECIITNTAIQPELTVIKHVVNNFGSGKSAADFTINVTGTNVSNPSFAGSEAPGTTVTLNAGSFSVDEDSVSGYSKSFSGDCSGTISVGEKKTCTITNTAVQPTLKLVKTVVNNSGGLLDQTAFQATINGHFVSWDTAWPLGTGYYEAGEILADGYTAGSWGGDCAADGSITLVPGQQAVCTITNTDQPGTIVVKKVVVNGYGGEKTAGDFSFSWLGTGGGNSNLSFNEDANDENLGEYALTPLVAGTYSVTEDQENQDGYKTVYDNCTNIDLANGETETCTINNYRLPTIKIVKYVELSQYPAEYPIDQIPIFTFDAEINDEDITLELVGVPTYVDDNTVYLTYSGTLPVGTYELDTYENPVSGWRETDQDCYKNGLPLDDNCLPAFSTLTSVGSICPSDCDGCDNCDDCDDCGCEDCDDRITVEYGDEIVCEFYNEPYKEDGGVEPILILAKSNNATSAKRVGDIVTYTLTLTNPNDFKLGNPQVTDTPPEGFVYIAGSWTAQSNIRGNLKTLGIAAAPTYASPGVWLFNLLGDDNYIDAGEIFTLTYKTRIDSLVTPGIYPDVAYATAYFDGEQLVFDNIHETDTPFVGTNVEVIKDPTPTTYKLVETGDSGIVAALLGSLMIGSALVLYGFAKVGKENY